MNWEEKGVLVIIGGIALWMFQKTNDYDSPVSLLPRWSALLVLVFVGIVLAREYVTSIGTSESSVAQRAEEIAETAETDDPFGISQTQRTQSLPVGDREVSYRYFLALFLVIYVGMGYFIGLAVPTVLFLGLYLWLTEMGRWESAGMFAVTLGILYVFGVWLETPLFEGTIEWMPTIQALL